MTALHEQACKLGYTLPLAQAQGVFRGRQMALCDQMIEASIGRAAPVEVIATVRQAMAASFRTDITAMPGASALLEALRGAGDFIAPRPTARKTRWN